MIDLPDVNVWLALSVENHPHHGRATKYWRTDAGTKISFCRVTSLGLLRLLTTPAVMGGEPLTTADAWHVYRTFRQLPEVVATTEPSGCDDWLERWATSRGSGTRFGTDAYLAAFASRSDMRVVTFDRDFEGFEGLRALVLR